MSELSVQSVSVLEVLERLRTASWLIPEFQRDFVWSVPDVVELVRSVLARRPIGMATVWEQVPGAGLELRRIAIPGDGQESGNERIEYAPLESERDAAQKFAVLDGLQRCTALALAFGGLQNPRSREARFSGRYFLNVTSDDPNQQVVFYNQREIDRRGWNTEATQFAHGHFPLHLSHRSEGVYLQWLRYRDVINQPSTYPPGQMPAELEIARRQAVVARALEGIIQTRLAVYVVPHSYSLADICEIFEKLNTTGTRVSTVDLIHSWLYSETSRVPGGQPLQLREWMEDLGELDGAVGWAGAERPELLVQTSTACYVALDNVNRPAPRQVGRNTGSEIASVKAADLLATPTAHWQNFVSNREAIAQYYGDFQRLVAGGLFPWRACPYPVTSALYVALRYHASQNRPDAWGLDDLNALFRAYFWRNALTNRFDQGFLTQLGTDIKEFKHILRERRTAGSAAEWARQADLALVGLIGRPLPNREQLVDVLTAGRPGGAMKSALFLPMLAGVDRDLLDHDVVLRFPSQASGTVQMHHIYPRDWCRNNRAGALASYLDEHQAGRDWVNSVANLMPLSRSSNRTWSSQPPGQVLADRRIDYGHNRAYFESVFIDEHCYEALARGPAGLREFWEHRAVLLADDLVNRMKLTL